MKIKHSKFKNTGLIYELLVKQIAADTLSKNESAAVSILKKYFGGNTVIAKELKLYEYILKNNNLSEAKAETVISSITEISRKLNQKSLKDFKYKLISEIKDNYNIEDFFAIPVRDYKPLAALYCLLEAQNNDTLVDPEFLVNNKFTILEHLTTTDIDKNSVKDTLIEEYSKYDKDLRLLTYKILLEKFNNNYQTLLPEQKNILKEFITSVNSKTRLRTLVNEEVEKIRTEVKKLASNVKDEVIKIKLQEVLKSIKTLKKTEKISDNHLINLMQYYDLVNEMRKL
jgi:hypothetical protein|tara:strand:- start:452 stop:1306 length:855 start_codon:yes stop_codon:yes gene_type:complete